MEAAGDVYREPAEPEPGERGDGFEASRRRQQGGESGGSAAGEEADGDHAA